ncbi:fimbrial biogenesis outer membrane usher protein [Pseudaeromonas paramecii]|uniref:Fimbrial biogenesis outer membrane usher protein n=2 Tax=Pseudaeromonas paramecii TaxID=2138166 RepID=A0ABP8QFA9_9GAMM
MAPCDPNNWRWRVSLSLLLAVSQGLAAEEIRFDTTFLQQQGGAQLDLKRLAQGPLPPGRYPLDVWVNEVNRGRINLQLAAPAGQALRPCLTADLLAQLGLRAPDDQKQVTALTAPDACVAPAELDPQISWRYDGARLALLLTVPQVWLIKSRPGAGSWQSGETAALLNYDVNFYRYRTASQTRSQGFLSLDGGLNWQVWRLRHRSTLSVANQGQSDWNNLETNLWRSLPDWQGRLTLGQSNTQGQFFDSVGYLGASLATDSRMLGDKEQGFAPVIRGQARSHARVSVLQQGRLLYQTNVPPGEFVIDDLNPTGYGGDLEVHVKEADGSEQVFSVANNGLPQLLRSGQRRYSATAGQVDIQDLSAHPALLETSWHQGLSNLSSYYLGGQLSEHYAAGLLGLAFNTPWGALSLDLTQANPGDGQTSQRWRARFNRQWNSTGSSLTLTGQQYGSADYRSLAEALQQRQAETQKTTWVGPPRRRLDLTLNQPLPGQGGSLYLSASWQSDWQADALWYGQLGYQRLLGPVSLNLSARRSAGDDIEAENHYQLSLSLPLGGTRPHTLSLMLDKSAQQGWQSQAYLAGNGAGDEPWSYGLSTAQWQEAGQTRHSLGANGQWRAQAMIVSGSVSGDDQRQRQLGLGSRGALLLHDGGLLTSRELGESVAIIEAPGAAGARLRNWPEIRLDRRGRAVAPYLTPFRENVLELDPAQMDSQVELLTTQHQVQPDAGAVIRLQFASRRGYPLLLPASLPSGTPLPFGAEVQDESGETVGAVTQGGQLYARVHARQGRLRVRWGDDATRRCQLDYQLPAKPNAAALYLPEQPGLCRPTQESAP